MKIGITLAAGAAVLVAALSGNVLATTTATLDTSPQPDMAKPNMAKPNLTTAQIVSVQKALIALGYDIKADGIWGSDTSTALMEFQKKHGLQATGYPDPKTLQALGISG